MGDASQAGNSNKSRFRSQLIIEGQPTHSFESDNSSQIGVAILYSHASAAELHNPSDKNCVTCSSLEDLLAYLESDLVDSIWFDATVSAQERNYITGWARIFRPTVTTHLVPEKMAN